MTKQEIIELLEKEKHIYEIEYLTYFNEKIAAMDSHELDRAEKFHKSEMDSYILYTELDYILSKIKE